MKEWREGKTTIKEAVGQEKTAKEADPEARFLEKVEHEVDLPDYDLFGGYLSPQPQAPTYLYSP